MRNWTPSTIGRLAGGIKSRTDDIDTMIWYFNKYGVADAEQEKAFIKELKSKAEILKIDIDAFKALNIDEIIEELL